MTEIGTDRPADERTKLARQVLDLQTFMFRSVRPARAWLEVDLTMPQLKVLFILHAEDGASMGRLATALGVTLSTVTGIVDRLVEHGLVQRQEDPQDRRLVVCRLTPRALTTVERLHQAGRLRLGSVLADLSLDELRTVAAGMEVLAAAFGRRAAAEDVEGGDRLGGNPTLAAAGHTGRG
jgi:MarR family transcriptional regulator, organic hydroperoxide resistance regulator